MSGVCLRVEERVFLRRVRQPNLDHPPFTIRVAVDDGRIGVDGGIHLDNLPGNGREEFGNCFHRLDGAEYVVGAVRGAALWELDKDDVTELVLRVVSNADCEDAVLGGGLQVFVVRSVQQVARDVGHGFALGWEDGR